MMLPSALSTIVKTMADHRYQTFLEDHPTADNLGKTIAMKSPISGVKNYGYWWLLTGLSISQNRESPKAMDGI